MAEQKKWTPEQIEEQTKKIEKSIEKHKRERKEKNFTSITREEIKRKLWRVKSPMIVSQGWGSAPKGGTVNYSVGIYNPDPTDADTLFAHVWIGSGNADPTVGTFLQNVDPRFPRLTEPAAPGLTLASNTSATLNFALKVPTAIEESNYIGNSCLMRCNWHDVGQYLDRGVFVFAVT